MNLDFSTGIVATYEEETDKGITRTYGSLAWQLDFDRLIFNDVLQFYHRHGVIWDLDQTSDVVIKTWTGVRGPSLWGIVTTLEAQIDWDSQPVADNEEFDSVYRIKLGYQW